MASDSLSVVTNPVPAAGADRTLGPDSVGEALRLLRHRARLSRDALAQHAGVSAGAISNYENDVSAPSAVTLRRLTLVLAGLLGNDAVALWNEMGTIIDAQAQKS
jgi:transcriptional regulator with XRE-family HTH domain